MTEATSSLTRAGWHLFHHQVDERALARAEPERMDDK